MYWAIIEKLRDSPYYKLSTDYNLLAYDLRCDNSIIKSIITDFRLFVFSEDGKYFYSESLCRRMIEKENKSKKARESVSKRWKKGEEKNENYTNEIRTYNESNTIKVKESKVKEIKEEDIIQKKSTRFILPTLDEVKNYCLERKNDVDYEKWFNFYSAKGWMVAVLS